MSESLPESKEPGPPRYERRDVDSVSMLLLVFLLLVGLALTELIAAGGLEFLKRSISAPGATRVSAPATTQFPEPRLQISSRADLKQFQARDEARLHSYGWVDRKAGTVRIPVDRAIELLLQRGLPKTSETVTPLELQQKRGEQRP
jgi:hypothetical protein